LLHEHIAGSSYLHIPQRFEWVLQRPPIVPLGLRNRMSPRLAALSACVSFSELLQQPLPTGYVDSLRLKLRKAADAQRAAVQKTTFSDDRLHWASVQPQQPIEDRPSLIPTSVHAVI
jgi:hypothetical protein